MQDTEGADTPSVTLYALFIGLLGKNFRKNCKKLLLLYGIIHILKTLIVNNALTIITGHNKNFAIFVKKTS
jgi:hypothetical protein